MITDMLCYSATSGSSVTDYGTPAGLIWEMWDKMSRVVVSRPGSIDNSEEELDEIRTWMIEHVTRFGTTFGPYLEAVLASMQENSQTT